MGAGKGGKHLCAHVLKKQREGLSNTLLYQGVCAEVGTQRFPIHLPVRGGVKEPPAVDHQHLLRPMKDTMFVRRCQRDEARQLRRFD